MGFFSRKLLKVFHPGIFCEQLEPRIVLNAAVTLPGQKDQTCADDGFGEDTLSGTSSLPVSGLASESPDTPEDLGTVFENDLNVVLVSKALDEISGLSDAANDDYEVVVFDETADGLDSMVGQLADLVSESGEKIGTLAVLTHGDDGGLALGTDYLNYFNWTQYQPALAGLATTLAADAQIQFYACSLAGDFFGQSFVDRIAGFTGADVFASINVSGGDTGDWQLEYSSEGAPVLHEILTASTLDSLTVELAEDTYPDIENNWAIAMGGILYYVDDDGINGKELWRSDGTGAGTYMLVDINKGSKDSDPAELTVLDGLLYFRASDGNEAGDHGFELWRSDGTVDGTERVMDINEGKFHANPKELTIVNGILYFVATDGHSGGHSDYGEELWYHDPSTNTTAMVADINPGTPSSEPHELTEAGGKLFFVCRNGNGVHGLGNELWVHFYDPATQTPDQGTTDIVYDINKGPGDSNPTGFTEVNGILYFQATDGNSADDHGVELWRTDGTRLDDWTESEGADGTGTGLVLDINKGNQDSNPQELTNVDGLLVFRATDGSGGNDYGYEIWVSTGTTTDTWRLTDVNDGKGDSDPTEFTSVKGVLYYSADDGTSGAELWKSEIGWTTPGTVLFEQVRDIYDVGNKSSSPKFLVDYDGLLLFAAYEETFGYEMWQSDGTEEGTVLLRDTLRGPDSGFPSNFARVNPLFFLAYDGSEFKLWKSDGTSGGTVKVEEVTSEEPGTGFTAPQKDRPITVSPTVTTVGSGTSPLFTDDGVGSISPNDISAEPGDGEAAENEPLQDTASKTVQFAPASGESRSSGESEGLAPSGTDNGDGAGNHDEFVPENPKITVLADGNYSISSATLSLAITPNIWLPPMVKWYLVAVGEGRYRPGALPPGYESMIWDFIGHLKDRLGKGQKPLEEMESRLAWQWAEWRKQVKKQNMSPDVLPWSYFNGLSDALAAFYQKSNGGVGNFSDAVKAMRHNAETLTIIPVKLPEETILRTSHGEPRG